MLEKKRIWVSGSGERFRREEIDERLPGKVNSNSHGARPVHLIITMIKWIRASRLSIKNSLSGERFRGSGVWVFCFRVSGFGVCTWRRRAFPSPIIILVMTFWIRVSSFEYLVWGFKLGVSYFGFQVSGIGFACKPPSRRFCLVEARSKEPPGVRLW